MNTDSNGDSALKRFWNLIVKIGTWFGYIVAPVIVIGYIYFALAGQVMFGDTFFIIIFLSFGIIYPFTSMLFIKPGDKYIKKIIIKTDWDKWSALGKHKFVLFRAYRSFSIFTTYFTILTFLFNYKDGIPTIFYTIHYFFIFLFSFLSGLTYGINAWNYKMNEPNTIRNKLIGFFMRSPG